MLSQGKKTHANHVPLETYQTGRGFGGQKIPVLSDSVLVREKKAVSVARFYLIVKVWQSAVREKVSGREKGDKYISKNFRISRFNKISYTRK